MKNVLLFDFNNLAIRNFFTKEIEATSESPNFGLWKYMIFEQVYDPIWKFKGVDEVVLAIDAKKSWRKFIYEPYKAQRQKQRDKMDVDWEQLYKQMNLFIEELKSNLPFKVLKVEWCEADDIIAVLSKYIRHKQKTIVTTDSDYLQLIDNDVQVYDPLNKQFMQCDDVNKFIQMSILKGQPKDNIFNIKTPEDWPEQLRKPPFGEKKAEKVLKEQGLDSFLTETVSYDKTYTDNEGNEKTYKNTINIADRYNKNDQLINLNKIPKSLWLSVTKKYDKYKLPHPSGIVKYFNSKQWRRFTEDIHRVEEKMLELY